MPTEEQKKKARDAAIRKHLERLQRAEAEAGPDILPRVVELARGAARVLSHPTVQSFARDFSKQGADAVFDRIIGAGERIVGQWRENLENRQKRRGSR